MRVLDAGGNRQGGLRIGGRAKAAENQCQDVVVDAAAGGRSGGTAARQVVDGTGTWEKVRGDKQQSTQSHGRLCISRALGALKDSSVNVTCDEDGAVGPECSCWRGGSG